MISVNNSKLLSLKAQLAKANRDDIMLNKIKNIKSDSEISEDIINYELKSHS